jgi:hypothetical protein
VKKTQKVKAVPQTARVGPQKQLKTQPAVESKAVVRTGAKTVPRKPLVSRAKIATRRQTTRSVNSGRNAGIPKIRPSGPLKMPKGTTRGDPEQIQNRLKAKSPWYQSILNPLHGADVKIPDATGVETGTLQLCQRTTVDVPVDGTIAFRIITVYPARNAADTGPEPAIQWTQTSNAGDPDWTAAITTPMDTTEPLQTYSDGVRVVSAAIYCQPLTSLSSNSGMMIGYINPFGSSLFTATTPLDDYVNHYKSALIPVNNNEPCIVRWYPIKQNGGFYDMFYDPSEKVDGTDPDVQKIPYYEMGVVVTGSEEAALFEFTTVINYEFTPFSNAINILDAKPSPSDAQEVDLVENWVQDLDPVSITSNRVVATPPAAEKTPEPGEDSGFGMFFEVVKEILPLAGLLL